jgi:hypothetical protein
MATANARSNQASSRKSNGHAAPPAKDEGTVVEKASGKLDDAMASVKAGLSSDTAKQLYLDAARGAAIGAGVTLGVVIVHKALN